MKCVLQIIYVNESGFPGLFLLTAAKQSVAKLIPLASTVADGSLQLSRPETKKEK